MKKVLAYLALSLVLFSCGSSDKKEERIIEDVEHETIKRDYTVTDASSNRRPGWIEDAQVWANQNGGEVAEYRYFSFETEPKVNRQVACDLAKANARADIAAEITTFIDRSLVSTLEGAASVNENDPNVMAMKDFVDTTLVEKVQSLVFGSSVLKTYWEKRNYRKKLGAVRDFTAFTCAVYIQMNRDRLNDAVDRAARMVIDQTTDPELKAKAQDALKDAALNFDKMRRM